MCAACSLERCISLRDGAGQEFREDAPPAPDFSDLHLAGMRRMLSRRAQSRSLASGAHRRPALLPTEPDPGPEAPHHTWIVLMETCVLLLECYFPFIFPSSHLAPGNDIPVARLKSLLSMMTQRLNSMG